MNRRLRTALAASAVLSAGLLMTACQGSATGSASASASSTTAGSSTAADQKDSTGAPTESKSGETNSGNSGSGASDSSGSGTAGSGSSDASGTGSSGTAGDKSGYGQQCGTNDISWSATSETQAGGYFLIKAVAKSGITCVIPAQLPVVAFGSGGTEAANAEQSAGQPITLKAGVAAYAAVNPKTTNNNDGVEYQDLIVSVAQNDPNPVSLKVGSFVEDKPVVSSWHTSATEAAAIFTN
ncbi:DUF4232 domain-containing protein [Streptomyces sp. NPDC056161]|uniref:DUF4232 domain-containing protein n=1 Tax=Streptomyces sp. NPDC056161 TaxID=3345732 RepID=UPI0035D86EF9